VNVDTAVVDLAARVAQLEHALAAMDTAAVILARAGQETAQISGQFGPPRPRRIRHLKVVR
jgi:hypothetical protein